MELSWTSSSVIFTILFNIWSKLWVEFGNEWETHDMKASLELKCKKMYIHSLIGFWIKKGTFQHKN